MKKLKLDKTWFVCVCDLFSFSWTSGGGWLMWPLLWISESPSTACSLSKSTWRVRTSSTPSWLKTCRCEACEQPGSWFLVFQMFELIWSHSSMVTMGSPPQVLLDEEQEEMESAARFAEPRSTDSFDYSNYHTISEVSTRTHSGK